MARDRARSHWGAGKGSEVVSVDGGVVRRDEDLMPAAEFCMRVIRRLDEAAEQVRRNIP